MPTHLYCLLPAGSSAAPPDSPPIRAIPVAGVVAWVSEADTPRLSRDIRQAARAAMDHDRVVNAALVQGVTPVPAALADPYESDDDAKRDIDAHAAEIRSRLDAVSGKVEMTVVIGVSDSAPPPDAVGRGRAYLEGIRSLPARAAAAADRIAKSLDAIGGEGRRRAEGGRVGISHLIDRPAIDLYRQAALSQAGEGYRLVVDGPRAPYSFACFSPRNGMVGGGTQSAA